MNNADIIAATLPRMPACAAPSAAPLSTVSASARAELTPANDDDPGLIGSFRFDHEGMSIVNPCLTETAEHPCSPDYYGFTIFGTGGGCTAWRREFTLNGKPVYMLLTDGDLSHEISGAEVEVGIYADDDSDNGEALHWYTLECLRVTAFGAAATAPSMGWTTPPPPRIEG